MSYLNFLSQSSSVLVTKRLEALRLVLRTSDKNSVGVCRYLRLFEGLPQV